jgi:hypothetical protein
MVPSRLISRQRVRNRSCRARRAWREFDPSDPAPGYFEFDWLSARHPERSVRFTLDFVDRVLKGHRVRPRREQSLGEAAYESVSMSRLAFAATHQSTEP